MHTVFALLCFVVVIHWLIFPYPSGLLHWHCGNLTIAPVPAKQPWWIWINTSCEIIMNDCITTTKQSTTKPCAYFLGYTVHTRHLIITAPAGVLKWTVLGHQQVQRLSTGAVMIYFCIFFAKCSLHWKRSYWLDYFIRMMTSSNGNIFRVTGVFSGNSPVTSGQWCWALMFDLICTRTYRWANNGDAGDFRRHRVHHDGIVMEMTDGIDLIRFRGASMTTSLHGTTFYITGILWE